MNQGQGRDGKDGGRMLDKSEEEGEERGGQTDNKTCQQTSQSGSDRQRGVT